LAYVLEITVIHSLYVQINYVNPLLSPDAMLILFSLIINSVFSERELHVRYVVVRPPVVCRLSVTFVHPTQPIEIFGNVSAPFNTFVT